MLAGQGTGIFVLRQTIKRLMNPRAPALEHERIRGNPAAAPLISSAMTYIDEDG